MSESGGSALAALDRLIVQIGAAINVRALYASDHPNVVKAAGRLIEALDGACRALGKDALTFLVVGEDLVVEQQPLRKGGLYHEQFVHALSRRGVERLTLARGLQIPECQAFLEPMATGAVPTGSPHIVVGRVEVRVVADSKAQQPARGRSAERIDEARDAFSALRSEKRGAALRRLEEVVSDLIDGLASAAREMLPLAPLKSHDEYSYVHAVNVSLLTLAQARSLGLSGDRLHAVGLAALLHDIGKLKIPLEILNKPGKLEGEEWRVMQSHAEEGARHLCGIADSHALAILVAYEHHMRFDGQPAYPLARHSRPMTLASQLTAIADVFDAIRTNRPYSSSRPTEVAFRVIRERAGTFHDPFLVANFGRLIGVSGE